MRAPVAIVDDADIFNLPTRSVSIPTVCPHCGADLTEEGSVREWGVVVYSSRGKIVKANKKKGIPFAKIECDDGFEECLDAGTVVTSYDCISCERTLTGEAA